MTRTLPVLLAGCLVTAGALSARGPDSLSGDQAARYGAIKPAAAEQKWKLIPWTKDLEGAVQTARVEGRPLLLWVSGDDPLERC